MIRKEELSIEPTQRYKILIDEEVETNAVRGELSAVFRRHEKGKILPDYGMYGHILLVTDMDAATAKDVQGLKGVLAIAPIQKASPA